jgi:hypothetical protein
MDIEIAEVAYHEAGHAVIAMELGFAVRQVRIEKNDLDNRWDGKMERDTGKCRLSQWYDLKANTSRFEFEGIKKDLAVVCAGFLAQAKHHALQQYSATRFSTTCNNGTLLNWMKGDNPELVSVDVWFKSVDGNEDFSVKADPRWFGGKDRGTFRQRMQQLAPLGDELDNELGDIVRSVIEFLDSEQIWNKVTRIAEALIANCSTSAVLLEDEIACVIASTTKQSS